MRRHSSTALFVVALMLLGACGIDFSKKAPQPDAGGTPVEGGTPVDGRTPVEGGTPVDGRTPVDGGEGGATGGGNVERFPADYFQSSGGGAAASTKYKLRFSAGMPQPMGVMSSGAYKMTIGPGAGRQ